MAVSVAFAVSATLAMVTTLIPVWPRTGLRVRCATSIRPALLGRRGVSLFVGRRERLRTAVVFLLGWSVLEAGGHRRPANGGAHGLDPEMSAGGLLDSRQPGTFVDRHAADLVAVNVAAGESDVGNEFRPVHEVMPVAMDNHRRPDMAAEMVVVHEDKGRVDRMVGGEMARWSQGRPTDATAADAPADPCRRPIQAIS